MNDFKRYREMAKRYQKLADHSEEFVENFLLQIAMETLREAVNNTPTGVYNKEVSFTTSDGIEVSFTAAGKTGGAMKRGWRISSIEKNGDKLHVLLHNVEPYSAFVEEGHRVVNKDGEQVGYWEGYHIIEISIMDIEEMMPQAYKAAWKQYVSQMGG